MGKKNPAIDAYIAEAAPFARPILQRIRKIVHAGCPDVVETLKWGAPYFDHKGPLGGMAAFKSHVGFGFWKEKLLLDGKEGLGTSSEKAMGQFGRLRSIEDLPAERSLLALIRKAADLNHRGVKVVRRTTPRPALPMPADFRSALAERPRALATFQGFAPSHRREYIEWITEAKTEATRLKRLETAVGWIAEGKPRNWKYMRK